MRFPSWTVECVFLYCILFFLRKGRLALKQSENNDIHSLFHTQMAVEKCKRMAEEFWDMNSGSNSTSVNVTSPANTTQYQKMRNISKQCRQLLGLRSIDLVIPSMTPLQRDLPDANTTAMPQILEPTTQMSAEKRARIAARKAKLKQQKKRKAKARLRKSKLKDDAHVKEQSTKSKRPEGSGSIQAAFLGNMEDLYSKIQDLDAKVLEEMVSNRELRTTILLQEQLIKRLNHTISARNIEYKALESKVDSMQTSLYKQKEYHRSVDNKLAGVMLDVAEVNNMLSMQHTQSDMDQELKDKVIEVEVPSQITSCSIPPNNTKYRDCEEVYHRGHLHSGVYYITPIYSACPVPVYCDMETPPGGWLVIQRRTDGKQSFNNTWDGYRQGFGDVTEDFWLGNDNIFLLTNQRHYELRVDLWDFYGSRVYAKYLHFYIHGERDRYQIQLSNHTGTAPDGMKNHNGMYFSTPDRDNDNYSEYHCAKEWGAGWWFSNCWFVILNGQYYNNTDVEYRGISWNEWKAEQLKGSEMKIRPSGF